MANELGPERRGQRREEAARHEEAGDQKPRGCQAAKRPRELVVKWLRLYKEELLGEGFQSGPWAGEAYGRGKDMAASRTL